MNEQLKTKRVRERLALKLPVRVHCRETPDFEWTEMTRLIDVTPFGAGFTLKRPTERGRLLHMTIPMPRQLRVFDHVEDQYKVWALVRYMRPTIGEDQKPCFEVGVAFVGKRPPASYEEDPSRRYAIARRATETGMPELSERSEENVEPVKTGDQRSHTRHNIPVAISLETLNQKGEVDQAESTVTENISRRGATVFTSLDIPTGRFVRVSTAEYNLTIHAVVRGRSKGVGGMPRLHLEFIDREWPVD
jgi:PilZ domain